MRKTFILGALLVSGAAFAAMPASAEASPADSAATDAKPEKQLCKRIATVGSRVGKRICMTRAEWKENERLNREVTDRVIQNEDGGGQRYTPADVGSVNPNNPGAR
jgi:hypothetical protein